jgi:hypothetical protein
VFPIDWLVIENITNLSKITLDLETKLKLKEVYSKIHKEEKRVREEIESLLKNGQAPVDTPVYKVMENRDKVSEDAH